MPPRTDRPPPRKEKPGEGLTALPDKPPSPVPNKCECSQLPSTLTGLLSRVWFWAVRAKPLGPHLLLVSPWHMPHRQGAKGVSGAELSTPVTVGSARANADTDRPGAEGRSCLVPGAAVFPPEGKGCCHWRPQLATARPKCRSCGQTALTCRRILQEPNRSQAQTLAGWLMCLELGLNFLFFFFF